MEFFARVRTLFGGCHICKIFDAECPVGAKKDWSLSQGREFMAVTGNKKVDKAVVEVLGVVLHCNQLNVKSAELLHRAVLLHAGQCNLM